MTAALLSHQPRQRWSESHRFPRALQRLAAPMPAAPPSALAPSTGALAADTGVLNGDEPKDDFERSFLILLFLGIPQMPPIHAMWHCRRL